MTEKTPFQEYNPDNNEWEGIKAGFIADGTSVISPQDVLDHIGDFNNHVGNNEAHGIGNRNTLATSHKVTLVGAINEHVLRRDNPNAVTKELVGLGAVLNHGVASKAQAEAGTSNSLYMTPLRVMEAIFKSPEAGIKFAHGSGYGTRIEDRLYSTNCGFRPSVIFFRSSHGTQASSNTTVYLGVAFDAPSTPNMYVGNGGASMSSIAHYNYSGGGGSHSASVDITDTGFETRFTNSTVSYSWYAIG